MGGLEYIEVSASGDDEEVEFRSVTEQAGYVTWVPVTSTNLDAIAYEEQFRRLWISYRNPKGPAKRYVYFEVPADKWGDLLASNSKGGWVDFVLKGNTGNKVYTHPYGYSGPF